MLKKDSYQCFSLQKTEKEQLETTPTYCVMSTLSVLRCSGEKVRDYLQGQVTQDMTLLSASQGLYTAILNPKGKCVSDAFLLESGDNQIDMIVPSASSEALVQRLRMFALGYQLRIGVLLDKQVLAIRQPSEDPLPLYRICPQYGGIHLPHAQWVIQQKDTALAKFTEIQEEVMQAWEVMQAIPRFNLDWDQAIYPLNAGLSQRQGISFDKGCYVGQEVASRMHWRKLIKSSFYRVILAEKPDNNQLKNKAGIQIGSFQRLVFDEARANYIALALLSLKHQDKSCALWSDEALFV